MTDAFVALATKIADRWHEAYQGYPSPSATDLASYADQILVDAGQPGIGGDKIDLYGDLIADWLITGYSTGAAAAKLLRTLADR